MATNQTLALQLKILPGEFNIHRFDSAAAVPAQVYDGPFFNICRTDEELSIVCADNIALDSPRCDTGWSGIKVIGPLDFAMTGILAHLSTLLAEAGISLFALSTYDTDYVLVKTAKLDHAVAALESGGNCFP
jgi:hypothetical protein